MWPIKKKKESIAAVVGNNSSLIHCMFCIKKVCLKLENQLKNSSRYKAMSPHVVANVLKGLGETAELNAGTVHARPSLNTCLLNQSHVQI